MRNILLKIVRGRGATVDVYIGTKNIPAVFFGMSFRKSAYADFQRNSVRKQFTCGAIVPSPRGHFQIVGLFK